MFRSIGFIEILIIALIIILFFDEKKISKFIKSIGKTVKQFTKASKKKS